MTDISLMKEEYTKNGLKRDDLNESPFVQFEMWLNDAVDVKHTEPNAFTLATVGEDMKPSQRTVLLKMYDTSGFVFFSNYRSKKVKEIEENKNVSIHFAWLGIERQVRIEGKIEKISKTESLKYFLSRPKGSQIGAWISHQSEVVNSRSLLESKFDEIRMKFLKGEVPFPSFWGGYIIKPTFFEFWQGGHDKLHDRFSYILERGSWSIDKLES